MADLQQWLGEIAATDPLHVAAHRVLGERLGRVVDALPAATWDADEDVEHVHRLRVSSRRTRAALRLFRELLPKKPRRWIGRRLKRLQRASGGARDLDVMVLRLTEAGDADPALVDRLRAHRREAQGALIEEYERLHRKQRLDLRRTELLGAMRASGEPVGPWATAAVRPVARRFVDSLPDPERRVIDYSELHRLRIEGKRLRYSLESLAGALPLGALESAYRGLVELQDLLGDLNDLAVAAGLWRGWALDSADPELARSMTAMADASAAAAEEHVDRFRRGWSVDRRRSLVDGVEALLGAAR